MPIGDPSVRVQCQVSGGSMCGYTSVAGSGTILIVEEKGKEEEEPVATASAMWVPHWLMVHVFCCLMLGCERIQRGGGECLQAWTIAALGMYAVQDDLVRWEG